MYDNGNFLPTYIVLQTLNFTKDPKQCFAGNKKAHYIAAKLTDYHPEQTSIQPNEQQDNLRIISLGMKQLILAFFFFSLGCLALQAQQSGASKPDLSVYPNPVIEQFTVKDNADVVSDVAVFNLIGKKVKTFEHSKGAFHYVGDLPKGVYLVQLIDKNNRVLLTQKMDKR